MKRYLAFAGSQYYPSGGMNDFIGDFYNIEDALIAVLSSSKSTDWWHVYDVESREIIRQRP